MKTQLFRYSVWVLFIVMLLAGCASPDSDQAVGGTAVPPTATSIPATETAVPPTKTIVVPTAISTPTATAVPTPTAAPLTISPSSVETIVLQPEWDAISEDSITRYQVSQHVSAIAFDEAGYLWAQIGEETIVRWDIEQSSYIQAELPHGLLAFDFSYCESVASQWEMPSDDIYLQCLQRPDGSYWFLAPWSSNGIYHLQDGAWTQYTESDGLASNEINDFAFDSSGALWVATSASISHFDGETWQNFSESDGLPSISARSIAVDASDYIWVGTQDNGVIQFTGQEWVAHELDADGSPVLDIIIDSVGNPWIPLDDTIYQYHEGQWVAHNIKPTSEDSFWFDPIISDVEQLDSVIWVATEYGALQIDGEELTYLTKSDGLADTWVQDIEIAPDSSLWLATSNGISHFDGEKWQTYRLNNEPDVSYVFSVSNMPDGDLWIGDVNGPVRFDGEEWTSFNAFQGEFPIIAFTQTAEDNLLGAGCAGIYQFDGLVWQPVVDMFDQDSDKPIMDWCVSSITTSLDDSVWFNQVDIPQFNGHGVIHLINENATWYGAASEGELKPEHNIVPWPAERNWVFDIVAIEDDNVWFATEAGLPVFDGNAWQEVPQELLGETPFVLSLTIAPDNALWLGTMDGFITYDGVTWTHYSFGSGNSDPIIIGPIVFDSENIAWMASSMGIVRFDGQNTTIYELDNIDPSLFIISDIAISSEGSLWLPGQYEGLIQLTLPSQ